jgi:hypothetical protein
MAMWLLLAFAFVGGLGLLILMGRRNEHEVRRDWELLLTPKGARVLRGIESRVRGQLDLANITYEEAFAVRELGSVDEAKELLEAGYKVLEHFCPNMFRLLAAMSTFSRMVSAMAPMPPLRPTRFHAPQISSLAHLHRLVHHVLVSSNERFRLRTYILGRSFALASRVLMRSTTRILRGDAESEREWEQVQAIRADMSTLTDESLDSLRTLLTSLAAERKEAAVSLGLVE